MGIADARKWLGEMLTIELQESIIDIDLEKWDPQTAYRVSARM